MRARIYALLILLSSILILSGAESGKKLVKPVLKNADFTASQGMMIGNDFAGPGFEQESDNFITNLPVFSYMEFNEKRLIGTGSVPMIIDINVSDTIAVFDEGEIVFHLLPYDKKSFIAVIQPSGAVIRIGEKAETLQVFENKSVNFADVIDSRIHLAVENELYVMKDGKFSKMYTANDRNISYVTGSAGRYLIGTDGNSRILSFDGKKTNVLYSGKKGEVDFIKEKDGYIYALVNEVSGESENMEMFTSYILRIKDGIADTMYTEGQLVLGGEEKDGGVLFFKSLVPELIFFDYKKVYSCGLLNAQFIMNSGTSSKGVYLITAEPGKIYTIGKKNEKASYVSPVINFEMPVNINSIYPDTEGKGRFYIRTGDTPFPDSTWADYMLVKPGMPEMLPAARYAVIKYDFADLSGVFRSASLFYKTRNRAPVIDSITVYYPRIVPDFALNSTFDALPVENPAMYPEYTENLYRTDEKIIFATWKAYDPDNDRLTYDVYLKDSYGRYPAQKAVKSNYLLLYTDIFPEGGYNVEIIANDSLSNGTEMLSTSKVSGKLMIDNTAPVIEEAEFKMNTLKFNAIDEASFINEAYYSINGSEFRSVRPDDMLFDSNREAFSVKIEREQNETMLIMIYVLDAYGNMGKYRKVVK